MLRFVASVMMVSGVLLIADAGVTLAWQEPVSAFFVGAAAGQAREGPGRPSGAGRAQGAAAGDAHRQDRLIPTIDKSEYVVEGTDADDLRKGPGHYPETPLPGRARHGRDRGPPDHLRRARSASSTSVKQGDRIVIEMPYGTFVYRVEQNQIVDDSALWVTKRVGYDRLVLSACHPLYSAAQRIVASRGSSARRPATVSEGLGRRSCGTRTPSTSEASRDSKNSTSTTSSTTEITRTASQ